MKCKIPLLLLASFLLVLPLWAQDGSKGAITTTPHDLGMALKGNTGELCGYCHIPHQLAADSRTLLWNKSTTTTAAYTTYTSSSLQATIIALDQQSAVPEEFYSLSCMSCHDGVTATNVVYRIPDGQTGEGTPGSFGTAVAISAANTIGTGLANDHPVNFLYNTALATSDGGLFSPVSTSAVRTQVLGASGQATEPVLYSGTVQCATCHNPHNNSTAPFLRRSNTTSALCLRCHSTT